jgi:hypothetical protein
MRAEEKEQRCCYTSKFDNTQLSQYGVYIEYRAGKGGIRATIGDKITAKVHADLAEGKTPAQIRAEAAKVLVSLGAGIKDEFNNMIATEGYKCRWRIKAVKMTRIHILLDNPNAAKGGDQPS